MAVREVNLIPAETLYARRLARRIRVWGTLMIALPAFVWGWYGVFAVRIFAQRQPPYDVTGLRRDYGLTIAEVSRLEQELNNAQHVQDLFHTQACSVILGALSEVVPEEVQIATCSIQPDSADQNEWRLVLTGQSHSNTVLGEFARQLEEHPTFADVSMTLSRAALPPGVPSEVVEKPLSGYRIECAIHVPGHSV